MGCLTERAKRADLLSTSETVHLFYSKLRLLDTSLLIETTLVTIAAILAIVFFDNSFFTETTWFIVPGILIIASIIPTVIKRRKFTRIGFGTGQIRYSLILLAWTCIVVFPVVFLGCWVLRYYGLNLPLRPMLPAGQSWIGWLLYQFLYVAVAEEVFFRGYVQGNILKVTNVVMIGRRALHCWVSIVVSAACFTAAHAIINGQIVSILTFLPGLIFGWLFIRTRSLLAPILFHGLANICYFLIAAVLA